MKEFFFFFFFKSLLRILLILLILTTLSGNLSDLQLTCFGYLPSNLPSSNLPSSNLPSSKKTTTIPSGIPRPLQIIPTTSSITVQTHILKYAKNNRTCTLIPTVHIAPEAFYNDVLDILENDDDTITLLGEISHEKVQVTVPSNRSK